MHCGERAGLARRIRPHDPLVPAPGGRLHFGQLSEVQPVLTLELLFLVFALAVWFRFNVGSREYFGALAAGAGLAGFLIFADPRSGNAPPPPWEWAIAAAACGGAMAVAVALALRGPRWWRAALFGTASAIGFAFTAALIKAVGKYFAQDRVSIFKHPQTYGLVLFGLASVYLAQNAYHAGPIVASQSTIVLGRPAGEHPHRCQSVRRRSADQRSLGAARSHLPPGPVRRSPSRSSDLPWSAGVKGGDIEHFGAPGRSPAATNRSLNAMSAPPLGHF